MVKKTCLLCGAPPETPRKWYCARCRPVAELRRRQWSTVKLAAWRAANPDYRPQKQRPPETTAQRGYGKEHRRLRDEWAPKVAAGMVACARCGGNIVPGTPWDLAHDPSDRSKYWGPEHAACNRGWNRRGGPEAWKSARKKPPGQTKSVGSTEERGLGKEHQKTRRRLLPLAYGTECALCGRLMVEGQPLDLDHVIPRRAGGKDGPVRMVHRSCNRRQGALFTNRQRRREVSRW